MAYEKKSFVEARYRLPSNLATIASGFPVRGSCTLVPSLINASGETKTKVYTCALFFTILPPIEAITNSYSMGLSSKVVFTSIEIPIAV